MGVEDLEAPLFSGLYRHEIRCSDLAAQGVIDLHVVIGEQWKEDIVGLPEKLHLKGAVVGCDADELNLVLQIVFFNALKQCVYLWRLSLTDGAIHAVDLNQNDLGLDLRYLEGPFFPKAEIALVIRVFRYPEIE